MISIITTLLLATQVLADCQGFTVARGPYTTTSSSSQRTSPTFKCNSKNSNGIPPGASITQRCNATECPTLSWGIVNSVGQNNLSLSKDQVLPLYSLISNKVTPKPITFLYSLSDHPGNISSCLPVKNNTSGGHWSFTPFLKCYTGTLNQCSNGPVADETAIEICAVDTFGSANDPGINGEQSLVLTNAEGNGTIFTDNPAASASPVAKEPDTSTGHRSERNLAYVGLCVWICWMFGVL